MHHTNFRAGFVGAERALELRALPEVCYPGDRLQPAVSIGPRLLFLTGTDFTFIGASTRTGKCQRFLSAALTHALPPSPSVILR